LRSNLFAASVKNKISAAMDLIFSLVPSGVGSVGKIKLNEREIKKVLESGARWAVENSFGAAEDLDFCEDIGALKDADCQALSPRAIERGLRQLGTLGSGNHFIELEQVAEIFDETTAQNFGLFKGQLVALIHTGSRGLGYQVCEDFVKLMLRSLQKYNIQLPDRQLACAPINSDEGKLYLGAMRSAANYAKANRQVITHYVREALMRAFSIGPADLGMDVVYDISHNIAKMERHIVDGKESNYCVHRKGATRAFAAGNAEIPARYRAFGQPILVPGSMGTSSYVLVGTKQAEQETFASVCHGAGRAMSRSQALKSVSGHELIKQLSSMNIEVRTDSLRTLGEEAPQAYKDISEVVEVCVGAGLAKKVARMLPLGVVKG
ncbi:MAG: RtcB family protein, partial [Elusimicrobia bacterium]|nr:RtcB family protein [Elusimicrobiota bacterium]